MLQLNTHKLKTLVLSVCILFSVSLFAQSEKTSDTSIIVMTEAELSSFLSTVADARRAQLQERESRRQKQDLAELRLKYQQRSGLETSGMDNRGYDQISNQQILQELRYLNQRIDNLSFGNRALPSQNRDNSTIIMPSNAAPSSFYPSNDRSTATIIPSNSNKIKELQDEIDSLRNVEANRLHMGRENSFADSLHTMKGSLDNVRRQLDSIESKMSTSDKMVKSAERNESKTYFKQQVYFENNSEILRAEYFPYIQDLIQILINYPEAKVMLEGWASPLGKSDYNKQLSMRRAEAVEKAFKNNRVDASRIIVSFRGEDNISSEQHARRVDMSIIVR
ncbi:OmpA family protein [Gelidibacter salicanalis]|uniref:OmpA family protein n=1 Tax=Gelidibacter salicanalis TaxID=291193 RepID=A0A5C7AMC3_9FLAO|nr:OmpA family protein [Gelidibacter salicanalis]TXE09084.1 OmpA family protein [Gelidibacter salicanalis]